jgi:hypothetical protein
MPAELPNDLYVRCEEKLDYAGKYILIPERSVNGYPIWIKESGGKWLFSSARNSRSTDKRNLKWSITGDEKKIESARGKGKLVSGIHNGKFPWEVLHGEWKWRKTEDSLTGTLVDTNATPSLPEWAESLWTFRKEIIQMVYVNQRDTVNSKADAACKVLSSCLTAASSATAAMEARAKASEESLHSCVTACMKACFPDLKLCIGSDIVWANKDFLMSVSPFFAAMLAEDSVMQEATTGQVVLPTADIAVVRTLLCLMYTSGAALAELALPLPTFIDVLAQAAEWECCELVEKLLMDLRARIHAADGDTAGRILKLVSVHARVSNLTSWSKLLKAAIERFAETRAGNLAALQELPEDIFCQVLACDSLDTGDNEAAVLRCVVAWAQSHGLEQLGKLLDLVRFPLIRFPALTKEEREALEMAGLHAAEQVEHLMGEATSKQMQKGDMERSDSRGVKRPRNTDESDVSDEESACEEGLDGENNLKRRKGSGIPSLNARELGKFMLFGSVRPQ